MNPLQSKGLRNEFPLPLFLHSQPIHLIQIQDDVEIKIKLSEKLIDSDYTINKDIEYNLNTNRSSSKND